MEINSRTDKQLMLGDKVMATADSVRARIGDRISLVGQSLNPSRIKTLPVSQLEGALYSLENLERSLLTCEITNVDPFDDKEFLKLSLKQLGFNCSREFIDLVQDGDLVEGYNLHNIQIFRNMRYMEVCGYSLEDVLTFEWPELYERSTIITDLVLGKVAEVIQSGQTIRLELGTHYMKERLSTTRQVSEVNFRYLTPLFASAGTPAGVLVSSSARVIDESPSRHELRFL